MTSISSYFKFRPNSELSKSGLVKAGFLSYGFFDKDKKFDELLRQNGYGDEVVKKFNNSINVDRFMSKKNLFLKKLFEGYKGIFETYVISPLSSNNKFSGGYANCQGIVGVGTKHGKNLSFMTHQCPTKIFEVGSGGVLETNSFGDSFTNDLISSLNQLVETCEDLDIVIFGGNLFDNVHSVYRENHQHLFYYKESLKFYIKKIFDITGKYPSIVVGPNKFDISQAFLFDTANRRLFCERVDGRLNGSNSGPDLSGNRDEEIERYIDMLCGRISQLEFERFMYGDKVGKILVGDSSYQTMLEILAILPETIDNNEQDSLLFALKNTSSFWDLYPSLQHKLGIEVYQHLLFLYGKLPDEYRQNVIKKIISKN